MKIVAVDQGTSSTRCFLFDSNFNVISSAQREFSLSFPHPGHVEVDAEELWTTVKDCIENCLENCQDSPDEYIVGITNQRETVIAWDKQSGEALYKAIVWMDQRTRGDISLYCAEKVKMIKEKTGLIASSYFSATKIQWLLKNVQKVQEAAKNGTLVFGTVDSWIIFKLNGKLLTDVSNASRTMLMNIENCEWDHQLLHEFEVEKEMLMEIKSTSDDFGIIDKLDVLKGSRILGCIGDQQSAMLGTMCTSKGDVKATYGTGCFVLANTGNVISKSPCLLSTVAYRILSDAPVYAIEGSIANAGSAFIWLRDKMKIIDEFDQIDIFCNQTEICDDLLFIPAFSGLFSPFWKEKTKASISGMSLNTTKEDFCRALVEGICFQVKAEVVDEMIKEGFQVKKIVVDGGLSCSNFTMKTQAAILGINLERNSFKEATVLGAALSAAFTAGIASIENLPVKRGGKVIFAERDDRLLCKYIKWLEKVE